MYESFYGLKEKPFSLLPDPAFLYLSKQHEMAITLLEYSLENQAGFCVITGKAGTGKTTLVRRLLNQIGDDISIGLISNTHHSFGELLRWILHSYSLDDSSNSRARQHQIFVDYLIGQYAKNRRTMLIIDEAQSMSSEALEELRMLSNINSEKDLLLQVILVGQPPLREILRRPDLEQFAQRVAVDYHLDALNGKETGSYIRHRLQVAGGERELFTDDACDLIFLHSGGIPRLINLLCDLALVYAYAGQAAVVTGELVEQVVSEREKHGALPIFCDTSEPRAMSHVAKKSAPASIAAAMPENATTRVIHHAPGVETETKVSAVRSGVSGKSRVHAVSSNATDETRKSRKTPQAGTGIHNADIKSVPVMPSGKKTGNEAVHLPLTEAQTKKKPVDVAPHESVKIADDGVVTSEVKSDSTTPEISGGSLQGLPSKSTDLTLHKAQPARQRRKTDRAAWSGRSISALVVLLLISSAVLAWRFLDWPVLMTMATIGKSSPVNVTASTRTLAPKPAETDATIEPPVAIPLLPEASLMSKTVKGAPAPEKNALNDARQKPIEREGDPALAVTDAAAREREAMRVATQARQRALVAQHEAALEQERAKQLAQAAEEALLRVHTAEMAAKAKLTEPVMPSPVVKVEETPQAKVVNSGFAPQTPKTEATADSDVSEATTFTANPCKGPSARFLSTCE